MKPHLLKILVCPSCKSQLHLSNSKIHETEITEGDLKCRNCQRIYKIIDSIPRFVKYNQISSWGNFNYYQDTFAGLNKSKLETVFKTLLPSGISSNFLDDKIILDAGCGDGLFINTIAKNTKSEVVGFDIGPSVKDAFQRNKELSNVHIIQADINYLPFKEKIFDFIYSIYVIHYLENPKKTFLSLSRLLKVPGIMTISVYPKKNLVFNIFNKIIRSITTRLPSKLLFYLCFIPVPLLTIFKTMSGASLKNQSWSRCASLLYIFYAPKYLHQFKKEDIFQWFKEAGFKEVESLIHPVTVTGKK